LLIVGIDPGNKGAIAFVEYRKDRITDTNIYDMPTLTTEGKKKHTVLDENELRKILIVDKMDHVFLEKAQSMPGQGAPGTFSYGCSYGIIRGMLVAFQIPYTLIHPATWKRKIMCDMDKGKDSAIVKAKQLFPTADIGKKDGRAEALLIAVYGKNNLGVC
jgi:crossover junction endodeoxyribonuclease RuvC